MATERVVPRIEPLDVPTLAADSRQREAELAQWFAEVVEPRWAVEGERGVLRPSDLAWQVLPSAMAPARGHLLLVNGRNESVPKYLETAIDLADAGYRVVWYDHRGQGLSGRLLDDPDIGYVADFDDYVDDMARIVEALMPEGPRYLVAHSMGGAIAAHYLARAEAAPFEAAVLLAPMMQIDFRPLPQWLACGLAQVLPEQHYAPGQGPWQSEPEPFDPATDCCTHSAARHARGQYLEREWPSIRLGGPSNGWIRQACRATEALQTTLAPIPTPLLLLSAGEDRVVRREGQEAFCDRQRTLNAHCTLELVPGAAHELLMERDSLRLAALRRILAFLADPSSAR